MSSEVSLSFRPTDHQLKYLLGEAVKGKHIDETIGAALDSMIDPPAAHLVYTRAIGKVGGLVSSPAKRATAAENGKKGGRPRKVVSL
jgi:hypothetical protein